MMGKRILHMYLDWEEDTCKELKELREKVSEYKRDVKKLIDDVEEEIEEIEEILKDLDDHCWEKCYFWRMQDYLERVYKRKLRDAL